ncbi:hypothetical protein KKE03_04335 [Patescibacteria group bacterium]|nr:hypothetical protein [Patescibacteria group bacterium]
MRIKLIILILFYLFLGIKPVFAVIITMSNIPPTITDEQFTFDVSVSGASAGTNYLRVDLYKEGSTNYFGETYNNDIWYGGSDGKQYFPITILSGQTWNGSIQGRIGNPTVGEYPGPRNYKLRLRRYTNSGGLGTTDQTPQDIQIVFTLPTPSPTQTPTPTPTPTPSSTSTSTSSFTISNIPSTIDSTEVFNVSVNLSLSGKPNTVFYLKGAFKKQDGTNYFGLTKVGDFWIRNNKSYLDHYKITTDSNGSWSGNLEMQPDILDSGYEGAGEYIFKVGRYTEDRSLSWSNETTIKINAQEVILEDDDSDILGITGTQSKQDTTKSSKKEIEEYSLEKYIKVASPASQTKATTSSQVNVKNQKQTNLFIWLGLIFIFAGAGSIGYIYLKKNANLRIPFGK